MNKHSPTRRILSWLLPLISLGIVAGLCAIVFYDTIVLRERVLVARLSTWLATPAIAARERDQVNKQTVELLDVAQSAGYITNTLSGLMQKNPLWPERAAALDLFRSALFDIRGKNWAATLTKLQALQSNSYVRDAGDEPRLILGGKTLMIGLSETAAAINQLLVTNQQQLPLSAQELGAAQAQWTTLLDQYIRVKVQLMDFLGIAKRDPFEESSDLPFYERGVLAGLPQISGLKDDIADAASLQNELQFLGAGINIPGSEYVDPQLIFQRTLDDLRSNCAEIFLRKPSVKRLFDSHKAANEALQISADKLQNRLPLDLLRLIIAFFGHRPAASDLFDV